MNTTSVNAWSRCLRLWLGGVVLVALGLSALACQRSLPAPEAEALPEGPPTPAAGLPWFEDVAPACGIDFRHFDSATPMHYIQETMGSGLGWIDYNNDGWLDLFCVQDGPVRP